MAFWRLGGHNNARLCGNWQKLFMEPKKVGRLNKMHEILMLRELPIRMSLKSTQIELGGKGHQKFFRIVN